MFGGQILVDALGAQAQIALGLDHVSPGLALARATAWPRAGHWSLRLRTERRDMAGLDRGLEVQSSRRAHWLVLAPPQRRSSRRAHWLVLAPPLACLR